MENIYQETIKRVQDGARFKIDLKEQTLIVDKEVIIDHGVYEGSLGLGNYEDLDHLLWDLEYQYDLYKHSIPSERSEGKRKHYFRALPEHKLDDNDMLYGGVREVEECRLVLGLLINVLNGDLKWDDLAKGQWFWQGHDPDFIILKEWIG